VLKKIIIDARTKSANTNMAPGRETTAATVFAENLPITPPLSGDIIEINDNIASKNRAIPTVPLALANGSFIFKK